MNWRMIKVAGVCSISRFSGGSDGHCRSHESTFPLRTVSRAGRRHHASGPWSLAGKHLGAPRATGGAPVVLPRSPRPARASLVPAHPVGAVGGATAVHRGPVAMRRDVAERAQPETLGSRRCRLSPRALGSAVRAHGRRIVDRREPEAARALVASVGPKGGSREGLIPRSATDGDPLPGDSR